MIPLLGEAAVTGKHQIPVQGSKKGPARARVVQARAEQTDLGLAKEAGIAAVAQYQDPVQIPRIDGVRCPVHQIGDELELGAQRPSTSRRSRICLRRDRPHRPTLMVSSKIKAIKTPNS